MDIQKLDDKTLREIKILSKNHLKTATKVGLTLLDRVAMLEHNSEVIGEYINSIFSLLKLKDLEENDE